MKNKAWFFSMLLVGMISINAQSKYPVSGEVFDENGETIPFATIGFYSLPDSSLVTGGVTDVLGAYAISIDQGEYYLEFSSLGYIKHDQGPVYIDKPTKIDRIFLKQTSTQMEELVVQAERLDVEVKPGVKKYNLGDASGMESSSALDVLQNLPSTSLDGDDQLSFRGRKVAIYIDGVETDLADMLDQLPANEIEAVEIMSNPSAKYDAKNGTSIINIISKKSKKTSSQAKISITRGTDRFAKENLGGNWSKNKISIGANANFKRNNIIDRSVNFRTRFQDDTTYTDQSYDGARRDIIGNYQLKIRYQLNNHSSLRWTGAMGYRTNQLNREYSVTQSDGEGPTKFTERERTGKDVRNWYRTDLHYKKTFKESKDELSAIAKLSFNERDNGFHFGDSIFNEDRTFSSTNDDQINDHLVYEYQPELKIDFTHHLSSINSLDMGVVGRLRRVKRTYQYSELLSGVWTINSDRTNEYLYDEASYAGYIVLNAQMPGSSSWTYQVGGRLSYIRLNPQAVGVDGDFLSDLVNFLPSLQVAHEINDTHSLNWSLTRRVRTPRYYQMNPYVTFYNPTSIGYGNPFLKNEKISTFEFGQTKSFKDEKILLSQSIYYNHIEDATIRYRFEDDEEVLNVTYDNVDAAGQLGLETTTNIKIRDKWKWNTSLNVFNSAYTTFDTDLSLIRRRGTNCHVKSTLSFNGTKHFSSRIQSSYFSKTLTAQGYNEEIYFLDFVLSQKLSNEQLTITFKIADILNTRNRNSLIDQLSTLESETQYDQNYHRFYITASYQIKKLKVIKPK